MRRELRRSWQSPRRAIPLAVWLYLNLWTPAISSSKPVMVFVHGGDYTSGASSDPTYDASAIAESATSWS